MSKAMIVVAVVLLAPVMALAKTYGDISGAQYIRDYDGDTITVNLPGLHPLIGQAVSVRLDGIDTPEIKGHCEQERRLAVFRYPITPGIIPMIAAAINA